MWPECNLGNLEVKNCHFVGVLQLSFFHEWKNCAGKGRKMPRWPFPDTVELALLDRDSVKWPVLPSEVAFLYMLCIDTKFRFFPSRQRHLASRKGAFFYGAEGSTRGTIMASNIFIWHRPSFLFFFYHPCHGKKNVWQSVLPDGMLNFPPPPQKKSLWERNFHCLTSNGNLGIREKYNWTWRIRKENGSLSGKNSRCQVETRKSFIPRSLFL